MRRVRWGPTGDHSAAADAAFKGPVPSALLSLTGKPGGSWQEVFGVAAAETFSAYYSASYVNEVAMAGQQEYNLPMYANCWLREHGFRRPGDYPSGGPVSTMMGVWKLAAPALAFLAPDIYHSNYSIFNEICGKYARADNPFFVRLLEGALEKIAELQGTGKLQAVGEEYGRYEQLVSLGGYDILFSFGYPAYRKKTLTGRALVGELGEDEFLIAGFDIRFQFRPQVASGSSSAEYLMIEEGYYQHGQWVRKRIWNGDEAYHSTLTPEGEILRIRLRKSKRISL